MVWVFNNFAGIVTIWAALLLEDHLPLRFHDYLLNIKGGDHSEFLLDIISTFTNQKPENNLHRLIYCYRSNLQKEKNCQGWMPHE